MKIYEDFELPSGGHLYPYYKGQIGECEGLEELERATPTQRQDSLICDILQKCLKEPFDVGELVLPDFVYLQIRGRVATYGKRYDYPIECPFCGEVHQATNLNELEIIPFDVEKWDKDRVIRIPATNDIEDRSGDEIVLRLPSVREREEIQLDRSSAHAGVMKVAYAIEQVNGKKKNAIEKESYAMELSQAAKRVILSRVDKLANFGVSLVQNFECERCKKVVSYPFHCRTAQFWLPTVD